MLSIIPPSHTMGIYAIRGPGYGVYVGSAVDIRARWFMHLRHLQRGIHHSRHLQAAYQKHGADAFCFFIVEIVNNSVQLLRAEQKWLDIVFATVPKRFIYNVAPTAGSPLGIKRSKETLRRKSEAARGRRHSDETKRVISERAKGRKASLETKAKISAAHQGISISDETRKKRAFTRSRGKTYTAISPDGIVYTGIVCVELFAREHGVWASELWLVLNGRKHHTKGWTGYIEGSSTLHQLEF